MLKIRLQLVRVHAILEAFLFGWFLGFFGNSRTASPTRFLNVTFKKQKGGWCVCVCTREEVCKNVDYSDDKNRVVDTLIWIIQQH